MLTKVLLLIIVMGSLPIWRIGMVERKTLWQLATTIPYSAYRHISTNESLLRYRKSLNA